MSALLRSAAARACRLLLLAGVLLAAQPPNSVCRIDVDPGQRFQRIDGFGLNYTGPYFRDDQKGMFDMLIDDLGATMFRVVAYLVYSNWEETNDNDDPNVMNWEYYNDRYSTAIFEASWSGLRYLNSRGIRPVVALMGPAPEWMLDDKAPPPRHKVCDPESDSMQNPRRKLVHLNPAMYEEFAEQVVSMAMYARTSARIGFDYFSPFNETDCYPPEGPRVDPGEAPKLLNVIARRLKKEGLGDIRLAVADQAIITTDYTDPILQDAELMKQVGAFTYHTYGNDSVGPQVERIQRSPYANLPVWLTEYGDLDDGDKTAENEWKNYCVKSNQRALAALNQGATALFFFNAFDDYEECARRLTFYGLFKSGSHVYTPKKRYYATKQLYRFVRPGARRISAAADAQPVMVSAFHNGAEGELVLVGVKQGGPNRIEVALPNSARGPAAWDVYATTRVLDCRKVNTVAVKNGVAGIELPDEAVFTLVGKLPQGN